MKLKILKIFCAVLFGSSYFLLPTSCYSADLPPGFEVYFNNPNGAQDLNAPGLDFRFKNYVDLASNTTIYASFYEIDNSTVVAALNSALNRGCTVYVISDDSDGNTTQYWQLTTTNKIFGNGSAIMHNKFCVIEGSSVWTGSWNATENCTNKNNNNVIVMRSTAVASIYQKEFSEMYGSPLIAGTSHFGSAKTATSNNGKTEYVGTTRVDIYFSPYSSPQNTNTVIKNVLASATGSIYFALFDFTDGSVGLGDLVKNGIKVTGIFEAQQISSFGGAEFSQYTSLLSSGARVTVDGNPYKLHDKFAIVDPLTSNAKTITGSHNWSNNANTVNDENTLVIYSESITEKYYEEFQRLYKVAAGSTAPYTAVPVKAVENVIVYPSPITGNSATIGFNLSANVTSAVVKLYTLAGFLAKEIPVPNITSGYSEVIWNCKNDSDEKVASGIYIANVEATTPDGTFRKIKKFAVIKGKQ